MRGVIAVSCSLTISARRARIEFCDSVTVLRRRERRFRPALRTYPPARTCWPKTVVFAVKRAGHKTCQNRAGSAGWFWLPELLSQISPDQEIASVTADGAYDPRKCHDAIAERGAAAVIGRTRPGPAGFRDPLQPRNPGTPVSFDAEQLLRILETDLLHHFVVELERV